MIRSMMGRKKVDKNTLLLLHFDGSLKDEVSGKPYVGSNMSYVVGKFKNCVSFSGNGYVKVSGTNAINESLYPNYTVDCSLMIGKYRDYGLYLNGMIDEFRISNIARWTSNFTPPARPY